MLRMLEPVSAALSGADCPILTAVGRAMPPGISAAEAWATVSAHEKRRGGIIDALTPEDRSVLDSLFEHLGETGREQQETLLTGTLQALSRNMEAARTSAGAAERLYLSLGFLTGLMLALIVI